MLIQHMNTIKLEFMYKRKSLFKPSNTIARSAVVTGSVLLTVLVTTFILFILLRVTMLAVKRAVEKFYSELFTKLNISKKYWAFSHISNSKLKCQTKPVRKD